MARAHTVLLVEDDAELRDSVERLLVREGYHVVATGDGLRAVELAAAHRIDLALVDLLIPGQSGFQVTTQLKARHGEAVRVVVMSGNSSPAHQDYALATGAERFLPKPFTVAQLFDTIAPPPEHPQDGGFRPATVGNA